MKTQEPTFWTHSKPLILASQSHIRRAMLESLCLLPLCFPATIDERKLEESLEVHELSAALAKAKALRVATQFPDHIVLGSDQTLTCNGVNYHKPLNITEAKTQLQALSGQTHQLKSSAAVVLNGKVLFKTTQNATLTMRVLKPDFIEFYLASMGEAVFSTVGGYQLEALGLHLFEKIKGDQFTILGFPLLPVLRFLRQTGYVQ